MSTPPPHSISLLVSLSGRTLNGKLALISGLWVNQCHGRRPRDQVTALAKRGTRLFDIVAYHGDSYSVSIFILWSDVADNAEVGDLAILGYFVLMN